MAHANEFSMTRATHRQMSRQRCAHTTPIQFAALDYPVLPPIMSLAASPLSISVFSMRTISPVSDCLDRICLSAPGG